MSSIHRTHVGVQERKVNYLVELWGAEQKDDCSTFSEKPEQIIQRRAIMLTTLKCTVSTLKLPQLNHSLFKMQTDKFIYTIPENLRIKTKSSQVVFSSTEIMSLVLGRSLGLSLMHLSMRDTMAGQWMRLIWAA